MARSLLGVIAVVALAIAAAHARVAIGGRTFDDLRYHAEVVPPRVAAAQAVRAGEAPGWWDGTGLGVPLAAEPSHGALYPPAWFATSPRGADLLAVLHLVWLGVGVALWARRPRGARAGASDPAALVAGILVATSGLLASAAIRGALPALAHLPWIAICAGRLGEDGDERRPAIALAALIALVGLSGSLAGLVDAVALAAVAGRRTSWRLVAAAVGAGLAVSCVQWLPAALQLREGAGSVANGLPLGRLIELIVPGSFGAADGERAVAAIAGPAAWAPSLYVGAPLLALAAARRPDARFAALIGGLAAAALVVGRGGWPGWLGAPEVHLAALVVVLGPHAAAGLDALVARERRAFVALAVGGGCTAVALVALAVLRGRHPAAAPAIDRALLEGGLGTACIAAALALVARVQRPGVAPILLALLALPGIGSLPSTAPTRERPDDPAWAQQLVARTEAIELGAPPPATAKKPAGRLPPDTVASAAYAAARWRAPIRVFRPAYMAGAPGATEELDDAIATLAGASAARFGIADARSTDPARAPIADRAWLASSAEGGALLDRFGIAFAILPDTVAAALEAPTLDKRGRWALVELPVAQPASVMRGWQYAIADDDALGLAYPTGGGIGTGRGTTVLRGRGPSQGDRGPPLPCAIAAWSAGDIALDCTTDVAGYAVVSSSPAPGWSVTVDDADAPWLAADVLRRGVAVEPGTHRVHWRYRTPGVVWGLAIAALGIAGFAALLARRHARASRSAGASASN